MRQNVIFLMAIALMATDTTLGFAPHTQDTKIRTTKLQQQTTSDKEDATKERRQPWDVLRFVRQSSKFVNLPFTPSKSTSDTIQPGQVIWAPSSKLFFEWAPLDDVVMGGVSSSKVDNRSGLWKGTVTDANNGGFVGMRSTPPSVKLDLSKCQGLEWTFQTTNNMPQRLKVVLRDSNDFNGIAWTACINVPASKNKQKQVTVKVPLKNLVPSIFAKIVPDAKDFDKSSITALQLVFSKFEFEGELNPKFKVGDFDVQVLQVKAY
ncbi:Complex I intermediate-associated protein 30 domain containing protein [Seminavis robusta]|uniref:Complex I intermediate-associated protein 30 domain containing protein n=1 Tax=Seminavis robusta TaxID=568900 RepID=A0A9N8DS25_9STRA|nr:Complex I intermediate-associated protein 30 domain containing protein [Seminavis robusta]|eukprot:Sro300_g111770.1 Complex I intermediate-associated protein 30 domain containing protein (264) ;mRNA; f:41390-42181